MWLTVNKMKKRYLYLFLPLMSLILEALPYGAVLNFADPEGESIRKTYSYFSLTPFGYANISPFITALLTCAATAVLIFHCVTDKKALLILARTTFFLTGVISLCPLLFGAEYFSVIGAIITVTLIAEATLLSLRTRGKEI